MYREGRRLFADELGIEPGPELQDLHQRVLGGDLAVGGGDRRDNIPARCLPRAISDFIGRREAVSRLMREIEEGAASVQLVDGMAGSGKTSLAVHVAAALGDRYPDAQLFIDLHGHSERAPVPPAVALATLLRQLGVPGERIPADLDDRVALWRSELSVRRAVIVLDNAASAAQVIPLLPNGPHCLTLVTSRRRLVGLDGCQPQSLALLEPDEAVELLARVAGAGRVAAEPGPAGEVVRRCGYLPLAIRLAGARLAHRPRWRVADLADRLGAGRGVLAEFAAEHRSVTDAFALSYTQVSEPAQRMFRLLGLHPGERFDNCVAAALADLPLPDAQDLLDELINAYLVEEPESGHFRFHDLMREYARQLLCVTEDDPERTGAMERLMDHHLHVAAAITAVQESEATRAGFNLPDPRRPDLVAACARQGLAWFDADPCTLTALVGLAEFEGLLPQCWQLARACWSYHYLGGHLDQLIEAHTIGLRAAERLADEFAIATMCNYLSSAYYRLGRFSESIGLLETALALRQRLGDRHGEMIHHWNLAGVHSSNGDFQQAMEHFRAAQALSDVDPPLGSIELLNNLAFTLLSWGRYDEALARRVLRDATRINSRYEQARALDGMARCLRATDPGAARSYWMRALVLFRQIGVPDHDEVARQLAALG